MREDDLKETYLKLKENLGVDPEILFNTAAENDWGFIIKISVIFEAISTTALEHISGRPELKDFFHGLPYADKKAGRLLLLKKLNVIEKHQYNFLSDLAEIRNKFAHDIKYINFSLVDYVKGLGKEKKEIWRNHFSIIENMKASEYSKITTSLINEEPKIMAWIIILGILETINRKVKKSKNESIDTHEIIPLFLSILESYLKSKEIK
jgi:hypothetical protein